MRLLRHLFVPDWLAMRSFSPAVLKKIEDAIRASETKHAGELRFAVEGSLPLPFLKASPRARAEALFAQLRVWDTEHHSGVLIYVQLVDRRIEIVADRGVAAKVEQAQWQAICRGMESAFGKKRYLEGALAAIEAVTKLLARHFPPDGRNPNELSDKPVVL